jgi:hypothetical protein
MFVVTFEGDKHTVKKGDEVIQVGTQLFVLIVWGLAPSFVDDIPAGATVMALSLLGGDLVLLVADRHRLRLALAALICPAAE